MINICQCHCLFVGDGGVVPWTEFGTDGFASGSGQGLSYANNPGKCLPHSSFQFTIFIIPIHHAITYDVTGQGLSYANYPGRLGSYPHSPSSQFMIPIHYIYQMTSIHHVIASSYQIILSHHPYTSPYQIIPTYMNELPHHHPLYLTLHRVIIKN